MGGGPSFRRVTYAVSEGRHDTRSAQNGDGGRFLSQNIHIDLICMNPLRKRYHARIEARPMAQVNHNFLHSIQHCRKPTQVVRLRYKRMLQVVETPD